MDKGFYCQTVAVHAESADDAYTCAGDIGMMTELLPFVDVGDMDFNDWCLQRADAVL